MKNILMLTIAIAFSSMVAACNTVEGAGQDIQKGGHSIERAADEHK
ncbi:MAG: Entericidin EcnA/B family [Micavibrio sp.]|nr:Entericidin EcnA/B family [Micavibrio sp.]